MTRGPWLACAALALAPASARAQHVERPRNVITWQPLSLVTGYLDLEYERALGRWVSVYAAPGAICARTQRLDGSTSAGIFAASLDVGVRAFPWRDAPAGFFVDAGVGAYGSSFDAEYRVSGFGVRGVTQVGYTVILGGHVVMSFGAGAQFTRFAPGAGSARFEAWPTLRFALGGAF